MKIFALYFKVKLIQKPEWFDGFRKEYDEPHDLHVTLIQPKYIKEGQVDAMKSKVTEVLNRQKISEDDKKLIFDKLAPRTKGDDGKYIFMVGCTKNDFLYNFQKELQTKLTEFNNYVDKITIGYENNFKPHITIAVNLDDKRKDEAEKYFNSDYTCIGYFDELILAVVKDQSIEERTNLNNKTAFKL
ncbi:MAG: 2'-5' RNA ligase family protein [bacterium]